MSTKRGDRILIADDDAVIRRLLQVNLRIAGFEVEAAASGHEAIERALADPPALVLLDLMMPGVDGWEVVRVLRAEPATAAVPVVVLSAKVLDGAPEQVWAEGISGFVPKPFDPRDVIAAVHEALGLQLEAR